MPRAWSGPERKTRRVANQTPRWTRECQSSVLTSHLLIDAASDLSMSASALACFRGSGAHIP